MSDTIINGNLVAISTTSEIKCVHLIMCTECCAAVNNLQSHTLTSRHLGPGTLASRLAHVIVCNARPLKIRHSV